MKVLAINDFHGYLNPTESARVPDPDVPGKEISVPAGGAAYLASEVAALRAQNPRNILVGAGDLVGASPLGSGVFHDEPVIQALDAIGMSLSSVGNHEFDEGKTELLRKQNGGCRPGGTIGSDTCLVGGKFSGAAYHYLSANVVNDATGNTLFPAYEIKYFDAGNGRRVGIAFIGAVLQDTATVTTASGIRGLTFGDEATAINAQLPKIAAQGVHAVVVLIHQGITTKATYYDSACTGAGGDLLPVLDKLDPAIKLVVSGHTHRAYICDNGQGTQHSHVMYTSAGKYGQAVSDIDVTLDVASDTIIGIHAQNHLVLNDRMPNPRPSAFAVPSPDPAVAALVARYNAQSAPIVNRLVGKITGDFTLDGEDTAHSGSGETAIGDLIADARVEATRGLPAPADIGIINAGGIRSPLRYRTETAADGDVTVGATYSVEPFGDLLYTETLTGAQIVTLLDEQWSPKKDVEILGVSRSLTYAWDQNKPDHASKVVPGSVKFNGKPIDPAGHYRVTVDAFLEDGGDGFVVLRDGTNKTATVVDRDALNAYIRAHSPLTPGPRDRITRLH